MDRQMLARQRDSITSRIKRIQEYIQQCLSEPSSTKRQHVEIRKRHLEDCWVELRDIQNKIELSCSDAELDMEMRHRETNEEIQFDLESQIGDLLDTLPLALQLGQQLRSHMNENSTMPARVKLPTIELPKFSGQYQQWSSYQDLFIALVHNNSDLSPVQKLFYLKSSLEGEAKGLLNSFSSTNANYEEAWKVLIKRYQNPRVIVNAHINTLFNLKPIQGDVPISLRKLLDTTVENIRALTVLGEATSQWNSILIHLVTGKLDADTDRHWELSLKDTSMPTFTQLQEFLEQRCLALEAAIGHRVYKKPPGKGGQPYRQTAVHHATAHNCEICNQEHPSYRCETLLGMAISERINLVKTKSLCFNCLRVGHTTQACKSSSCRKCSKRHHTILHKDLEPPHVTHTRPPTQTIPADNIVNHFADVDSNKYILLSTALIMVKDINGEYQQCRALLDSGSQASFLTESCAQRLMLRRRYSNTSVASLGNQQTTTTRGSVTCHLSSLDGKHRYTIDVLILPKITGPLPQRVLDPSLWKHIRRLRLADPAFNQPATIDILLGADIYAELIVTGKRKGILGMPTAQQTTLGWVLSGGVSCIKPAQEIASYHITSQVDIQLRQFWELEELTAVRIPTRSERQCEDHFRDTHTRDETGRFTVHLPFDPDVTQQLGESKTTAVSRFMQLEARLNKQVTLYALYRDFLKEYADLGHMTKITSDRHTATEPYYIPHHVVLKESSTTTRLRVVFDASSKSCTGISLNDKLLVGPTVQDSLIAITLRFRIYPYVFTADIAKMFRQVRVHQDDRHYQRILWRNTAQDPIDEYELNTVTYGTACGTYLATKVLQQLSIDGAADFPLGSQILAADFYVDDLMSGAMTVSKAVETQKQLMELLLNAGFELRKWSGNNQHLLAHIPRELHATEESLTLSFDAAIKTLGLQWHPNQDHFSFSVKLPTPSSVTKRTILSLTAQLFDPLAWLSPVIIKFKMLMQRLWLLGVTWDEPLPLDIVTNWRQQQQDLSSIQDIRIPRHTGIFDWSDHYELHGFCDSSEAAYAAVAYIRTVSDSGNAKITMLCAKTRVAPLKQLSLPRLELCGASLLAKLLALIVRDTKLIFKGIYAWTDSTVVLAWLASPPQKWTTFVANRVSEIQDLIPPQSWKHVKSGDNPADCASRGLAANQLKDFKLWWNGPSWLSQDDTSWRVNREFCGESTSVELRPAKITLTALTSDKLLHLLHRYSSFSTLVMVTAYCMRFANNCRLREPDRLRGPITTKEFATSLQYWIRSEQHCAFAGEISSLRNDRQLSSRSHIASLNPFLDSDGLLRVGGRLGNASLSFDQKHPILLPAKSNLTLLLVKYEHIKGLHSGPQLLLAIIRHKYWIPGGRNLVRGLVQKCVTCHRQRAQVSQQLMGGLPAYRVQPGRPFAQVGIDYGGPINVRISRLRGASSQRTYKSYIALLVCMVTKAVHLELVTGLTTEALMAALQRFMARRGKPSDIYSDCGTNFKGADSELKQLYSIAQADTNFGNQLSSEGITWHFIPPGSPHFGGLWEAGIRSTKGHLLRVVGTHTLTFEELYTLLVQVEACLNSRPLCPLSSDPCELEALTPGHFLIGQALTKPPETELDVPPANRLAHWKLVQSIHQAFWKRWSNEYLSRLQQRPKWTITQPNLEVGRLVLLRDKGYPPLRWGLARIVETHPGEDGLVRVVTLKTSGGTFRRAITNISPLPFEN